MALILQATNSLQGNINPTLYSMVASSPGVFHDITTGSNAVPCQAGTPDCPSGGEIGYSAGPGYDLATGLGSVDAFNLVSAWGSTTQPGFQLGLSGSTLTVSYGSSGALTASITPVNGFTGIIQFNCAPSSGLGATSCSVSPTSVSKSGNVTVTITAPAQARSFPVSGFQRLRSGPELELVLPERCRWSSGGGVSIDLTGIHGGPG